MNVLVGCEFTGTVRDAFASRGHYAKSCDLRESESPGNHFQGDIVGYLESTVIDWDLIILHPDCTCLTVAGNSTYGYGKARHCERVRAAAWTEKLWQLAIERSPKVCLENPVSVLANYTALPKASYVHPWQRGHKEQKKTGLHLHGLDPITETHNVYEEMMLLPVSERQRLHWLPPSADRAKERSRTFAGIAEAMADQWGDAV